MQRAILSRVQAWAMRDEATVLRTLNAFAVDLMSIPSAEDLFWYVAQNVVGKLGFVDCVIYEADREQTGLRQVAAWGVKNPFGRSIVNPMIIPFGKGITGRVAETRASVIVDDLVTDGSYIRDTEIARSEICVPLVLGDRLVGVIDSEHPEAHAFGEAELEILTTVAAMAAGKLALLEETRRSVERYCEIVTAHAQLSREVEARRALEARLFESRKLEALGQLTGRLAHEFNNILTVVLGNLELAEMETRSPEQAACLASARQAADRGAGLMRDMLVFANRARLVPEVLDLSAVVARLHREAEPGISCRLEPALAKDLWPVSIDPNAIETVLCQLVRNAANATPADGRIRIATENFLRGMSEAAPFNTDLPPGRYVRLTVSDNGCGIPARHLEQVFDPFFTTKPVGAGAGLGLSIVRGFVQQSGGAVTVTSEPGRGACFAVYLPAFDPCETRDAG